MRIRGCKIISIFDARFENDRWRGSIAFNHDTGDGRGDVRYLRDFVLLLDATLQRARDARITGVTVDLILKGKEIISVERDPRMIPRPTISAQESIYQARDGA